MKRKRFIKLLMADYISREEAEAVAESWGKAICRDRQNRRPK